MKGLKNTILERVLTLRDIYPSGVWNSDEWQDNTDKPFPEIILICPNPRLKSHLDHFIQNKLNDEEEPAFWLGLKNDVANKGLNRETLQKVIVE